jgi:hypothetical protein
MIIKLKCENEKVSSRVTAFKSGGIKLISEEVIQDANKELFYYG